VSEPIPVLTLWQPWASLVALGVKTIETRSWSTKYRGPIAIHAAARRPRASDLPGAHGWIGSFMLGEWCDDVHHVYDERGECDCDDEENVLGRCAAASNLQPALLRDAGGSYVELATYLPLGAVVATAELVDVVKITTNEDGALKDFVCLDIGGGLTLYRFGGGEWNPPTVEDDITDQVPYGDFTEGRFAWVLGALAPLVPPVPFRGGQALTRRWLRP
jgi:activating signal cointegrator 1